jgi:N-acetyltransferase 10
MVKKKIDNRIRVMIENGVKMKHRTMFVVVGDKSKDQVSLQKSSVSKLNKPFLFSFRCQFSMTCS